MLLNGSVGEDSWDPWTGRRSNQSILKEISHEYSLEEQMLKWNSNTLATWCEELTHWKKSSCLHRLKAGEEVDDRMRRLNCLTYSIDISLRNLQELVMDSEASFLHSMGPQRVRHTWLTELTDLWCLKIQQLYCSPEVTTMNINNNNNKKKTQIVRNIFLRKKYNKMHVSQH